MAIYYGTNKVKPSGIKTVYYGSNQVYTSYTPVIFTFVGSSTPSPIAYVKRSSYDVSSETLYTQNGQGSVDMKQYIANNNGLYIYNSSGVHELDVYLQGQTGSIATIYDRNYSSNILAYSSLKNCHSATFTYNVVSSSRHTINITFD